MEVLVLLLVLVEVLVVVVLVLVVVVVVLVLVVVVIARYHHFPLWNTAHRLFLESKKKSPFCGELGNGSNPSSIRLFFPFKLEKCVSAILFFYPVVVVLVLVDVVVLVLVVVVVVLVDVLVLVVVVVLVDVVVKAPVHNQLLPLYLHQAF